MSSFVLSLLKYMCLPLLSGKPKLNAVLYGIVIVVSAFVLNGCHKVSELISATWQISVIVNVFSLSTILPPQYSILYPILS